MLNTKQHMVMDIIHGGINLSADEIKVIDHPLFQRLRFISQNDVLSMVFPGATHSRFEHSIGACHMAGRFFDSIVSKGYSSGKLLNTPDAQNALDYLRRCVRMAVLLHDIGHGAFSHQLEKSPVIQSILQADGHFQSLWDKVDQYGDGMREVLYGDQKVHVEHEHYSVAMAYRVLSERHDINLKLIDVLAVMETTADDVVNHLSDQFIDAANTAWSFIVCNTEKRPKNEYETAQQVRMFLRSILTNELDADKSDYMLRDSQYSSVSYGNYNIDTLIDNLACIYLPEERWMGLGLVRKGLSAFEDFTYSRFQLYRQIYSHKTALMFNVILREAIQEIMQVESIYETVLKSLTDPDCFVHMTDHYFWEAFRHHAVSDPSSYSAMLVMRKKMKFISRHENLPDFQVNVLKSKIAKSNGVSKSDVFHYKTKAKFSAIDTHFDKIRVICQGRDGLDFRSFHEETDFFKRFENLTITNFYLKHG